MAAEAPAGERIQEHLGEAAAGRRIEEQLADLQPLIQEHLGEAAAGRRIEEQLADLQLQYLHLRTQPVIDYFSSLCQSLDAQIHSLDDGLRSIAADKRSLEAISRRRPDLSSLEFSPADALPTFQHGAGLTKVEQPDAHCPPAGDDLEGLLRWYAHRMDSSGLWRLVASRRKDLAALPREIADAVAQSLDPARLVIDAVENFLGLVIDAVEDFSGWFDDIYWALEMLLRSLLDSGIKKESAAWVAEWWKEKFGTKGDEGEETMGGSEARIFLHVVAAFGLRKRFEEEYLKKLFMEHASRKEIAKLASALGFEEQLAGVIDELIKSGKEVEAVYLVHESGLHERFPPESLLKSYLQISKKKAKSLAKDGNNSNAGKQSTNLKIDALKSIIKCVEICNLESKFSIDGLKKRLAALKKIKSEKKKKPATSKKSQGKRSRAAESTVPTSRPVKAARTPDAPYHA